MGAPQQRRAEIAPAHSHHFLYRHVVAPCHERQVETVALTRYVPYLGGDVIEIHDRLTVLGHHLQEGVHIRAARGDGERQSVFHDRACGLDLGHEQTHGQRAVIGVHIAGSQIGLKRRRGGAPVTGGDGTLEQCGARHGVGIERGEYAHHMRRIVERDAVQKH